MSGETGVSLRKTGATASALSHIGPAMVPSRAALSQTPVRSTADQRKSFLDGVYANYVELHRQAEELRDAKQSIGETLLESNSSEIYNLLFGNVDAHEAELGDWDTYEKVERVVKKCAYGRPHYEAAAGDELSALKERAAILSHVVVSQQRQLAEHAESMSAIQHEMCGILSLLRMKGDELRLLTIKANTCALQLRQSERECRALRDAHTTDTDQLQICDDLRRLIEANRQLEKENTALRGKLHVKRGTFYDSREQNADYHTLLLEFADPFHEDEDLLAVSTATDHNGERRRPDGAPPRGMADGFTNTVLSDDAARGALLRRELPISAVIVDAQKRVESLHKRMATEVENAMTALDADANRYTVTQPSPVPGQMPVTVSGSALSRSSADEASTASHEHPQRWHTPPEATGAHSTRASPTPSLSVATEGVDGVGHGDHSAEAIHVAGSLSGIATSLPAERSQTVASEAGVSVGIPTEISTRQGMVHLPTCSESSVQGAPTGEAHVDAERVGSSASMHGAAGSGDRPSTGTTVSVAGSRLAQSPYRGGEESIVSYTPHPSVGGGRDKSEAPRQGSAGPAAEVNRSPSTSASFVCREYGHQGSHYRGTDGSTPAQAPNTASRTERDDEKTSRLSDSMKRLGSHEGGPTTSHPKVTHSRRHRHATAGIRQDLVLLRDDVRSMQEEMCGFLDLLTAMVGAGSIRAHPRRTEFHAPAGTFPSPNDPAASKREKDLTVGSPQAPSKIPSAEAAPAATSEAAGDKGWRMRNSEADADTMDALVHEVVLSILEQIAEQRVVEILAKNYGTLFEGKPSPTGVGETTLDDADWLAARLRELTLTSAKEAALRVVTGDLHRSFPLTLQNRERTPSHRPRPQHPVGGTAGSRYGSVPAAPSQDSAWRQSGGGRGHATRSPAHLWGRSATSPQSEAPPDGDEVHAPYHLKRDGGSEWRESRWNEHVDTDTAASSVTTPRGGKPRQVRAGQKRSAPLVPAAGSQPFRWRVEQVESGDRRSSAGDEMLSRTSIPSDHDRVMAMLHGLQQHAAAGTFPSEAAWASMQPTVLRYNFETALSRAKHLAALATPRLFGRDLDQAVERAAAPAALATANLSRGHGRLLDGPLRNAIQELRREEEQRRKVRVKLLFKRVTTGIRARQMMQNPLFHGSAFASYVGILHNRWRARLEEERRRLSEARNDADSNALLRQVLWECMAIKTASTAELPPLSARHGAKVMRGTGHGTQTPVRTAWQQKSSTHFQQVNLPGDSAPPF